MKNAALIALPLLIFSFVHLTEASAEEMTVRDYDSEQWPKYVFPVEGPAGKVKTITETAFTSDPRSDDGGRVFKYRLILRYDTEGLLQSEEYYDEKGDPGNRIDYTYENGRLVLKTQSHPEIINPDREIFTTSSRNKIMEVEKIFSTGNYGWRFRNSYDQDGKIILTSKYDRYWNWKLVYSRMFQYDKSGKLSSTEGFGMQNELLWRDEYKYNDEGLVSESVKYNPDGELVVRIVNQYDQYGNYSRREFFDMKGVSYAVYSYGWNFDSRGNWTAKVIGREVRGSNESYIIPDSMIIRDIEYYG